MRGPFNWKTCTLLAIRKGKVEVLDWAHENAYPMDLELCAEIGAKYGHLELLKWVMGNGYALNRKVCAKRAIRYGHLPAIQWMIEKGNNKKIGKIAARRGHLFILQWLHSNGYLLLDKALCYHATLGGQIQILRWLRTLNCPWNGSICSEAAHRGYIKILK